jgi:pyridoxamine 5'-phosphate oxidase
MSEPEPDHSAPLLESAADADPFVQFARWYEEAGRFVRVPEAAAVATADGAGHPSVRMVLVKGFDERGFVFFTNYDGRKGRELEHNPWAAMLFHWDELGRQVRIEGEVAKVSAAESDEYFATRPRGAQVAAHASDQSEVVRDRVELDRKVEEAEARFTGQPVPRPAHWGGYRLRPVVFEFWQNRDDRLHDRLRYTGAAGRWVRERLQP